MMALPAGAVRVEKSEPSEYFHRISALGRPSSGILAWEELPALYNIEVQLHDLLNVQVTPGVNSVAGLHRPRGDVLQHGIRNDRLEEAAEEAVLLEEKPQAARTPAALTAAMEVINERREIFFMENSFDINNSLVVAVS